MGAMNRGGNGQEGSITVMVTLVLPILILMLVLIININQLFFKKIKLQATVDACALSAAAVQAAGMNEIADLNREMADESDKLRHILGRGTWYSYATAMRARNFFSNGLSGVLDNIRRYQDDANTSFALKADMIAFSVKEKNLPEASIRSNLPVDKLAAFVPQYRDYPFRYYTVTSVSPKTPPRLTRRWLDPDDPRYAGGHDGSYTILAKRIIPLPDVAHVPYELKKTSKVLADYELLLPPQDFLFSSTIFGTIPQLRARAVAKPAGGYISGGTPTYEAILVR